MQLIPGGGAGIGPSDENIRKQEENARKIQDALAQQAEREKRLEDQSILEAKQKQMIADLKQRRGRKASILTSARGVENELGFVNRPQARAAALLGE